MRLLAVLLLLFSPFIHAYPLEELKLLTEDVTKIYDGDTITIQVPYIPDVFGKDLSVRVAGIDTPEIRSSCDTIEQREYERAFGHMARDFTVAFIASGTRLTLTNLDRDKYFRIGATVLVDDRSLGDALIARGLAVPYFGETKPSWCNPPEEQ